MVREFGREDAQGRINFRHTIGHGNSPMGFYVANESNRIIVRHREVSDTAWPYWTHDRLINALVSKLRRLIPVRGRQRTRRGVRQVSHEVARLY